MTRIKFCGCTGWDDVRMAVEAGADAFGMIFADSPRRIHWDQLADIALRVPAHVTPVGVFVNPTTDEVRSVRRFFPTMMVQLSGDESPEFAASLPVGTMKTVHVGTQPAKELERACNRYRNGLVLFDTASAGKAGGSGIAFEWDAVKPIVGRRNGFIAGGLTPENVGACVTELRPFGVDVRSGIESGGRKDFGKMRAFVEAVRKSDAA